MDFFKFEEKYGIQDIYGIQPNYHTFKNAGKTCGKICTYLYERYT